MDTRGANTKYDEKQHVLVDPSDFWPAEAIEGDGEDFLAILSDFYQKRGTAYIEEWRLGTVQIDPKAFFDAVCSAGGFFAVNEQMAWPQVLNLTVGAGVYASLVLESSETSLVNAAMNLYWTKLYALERVHLESKLDIGVDFTKVHYTDPSLASYLEQVPEETGLKSQFSNHAFLGSQTPSTAGTGSPSVVALGVGDESPVDRDPEGDASTGEGMRMKARVERMARSFTSKYVPLTPSALMEIFTTRPKHGRPMTWRHQTDPSPLTKLLTNDFTKTPIPKVSSRLMCRQRESLLIRRIERAFNDDTNGKERAIALTALQTRSWSKMFFMALYPTLLESLLQYTLFLLERLNTSSTASHLFNLPQNEAESDITYLLRVSIILRNLSETPHNLNLLASHAMTANIITKFINLRKSLESTIPDFKPITSRSFSEIQNLYGTLKDNDQHSLIDLLDRTEGATENVSSSLNDPLKVIGHLKSNELLENLAKIQFNALEALSKMVHLVKLAGKPLQSTFEPSTGSQSAEVALSEQGVSIMECLPTLIEIVTNPTSKGTMVFLCVESLAKLALNSNSHPMWQSQSSSSKAELISTLVRFAVMEDELSDWSLFAAVHLSLNALDLTVAQSLSSSEKFLNDLMLMITNYATPPKTSSPEQLQIISYRRHTFATRSATILHRLVEFVPLNAYLLSFERAFADIYMHAPPDLANPLYRVFVEMQT